MIQPVKTLKKKVGKYTSYSSESLRVSFPNQAYIYRETLRENRPLQFFHPTHSHGALIEYRRVSIARALIELAVSEKAINSPEFTATRWDFDFVVLFFSSFKLAGLFIRAAALLFFFYFHSSFFRAGFTLSQVRPKRRETINPSQ